jgi:chitinase
MEARARRGAATLGRDPMFLSTTKHSRFTTIGLALGLTALGCGATATPDPGGPGPATGPMAVESLLPEALFEQLFLHRGTAPCQGAFYTYRAFLAATLAFPDFATQGSADERKRELAAFLANVAHETTGGWATAPDGPYSWGLCWINEGATVPPSQLPDYCAASAQYPCQPGKKYFGRGPIQLSYNYNYGLAGDALAADLLHTPELVATDPTIAWKTALWFWMTAQTPKPSCHDVSTGRWTPSAADLSAGRQPGFGLTINIINGGVECNQPTPPQVTDRVGFYNHFTQLLGTTTGANLTCDKMQSY